MLGSSERASRTARSFGFWPRRLAPKRRRNSFGRKSSRSQSRAWKGAETGAEEEAAGSRGLAGAAGWGARKASGEQLVGLRENFGRLILTATERTSSVAPPKT